MAILRILSPKIASGCDSLANILASWGGLVAEWLACWTEVQPGFKSQSRRCRATVLGKLLSRASVHQAAKLVAALLRVAGVTAGLAESNGSLPAGI